MQKEDKTKKPRKSRQLLFESCSYICPLKFIRKIYQRINVSAQQVPSSAQQEINESVSVRKMFVEEVSRELDISPDEIYNDVKVIKILIRSLAGIINNYDFWPSFL